MVSSLRDAYFASIFALVVLGGCGRSSERVATTTHVRNFPCQSVSEVGVWESAPPQEWAVEKCRWLPYNANGTFTLWHPLGRSPSMLLGYVASSARGDDTTLAAGEVFLIESFDEEQVTIRNDSDQDLFLRLVLF